MIIINKTKKSPGGLFMRHCYFLGSTSPDGFKTSFSDIINDDKFYTYILKGGPGTGKSTLMRIMCGYLPQSTGIVTISSFDVEETYKDYGFNWLRIPDDEKNPYFYKNIVREGFT